MTKPKIKLEGIDPGAFSRRLYDESERACAVLGAALLDAKLEDLCRRGLCEFQDELFGSMGPLGSFGARIRLARGLSWISPDVRFDLDLIRKVRNSFAHSFDYNLSFEDASIAGMCSGLRSADSFVRGTLSSESQLRRNLSSAAIEAMVGPMASARGRFQLAIDFLSQYFDEVSVPEFSHKGPDLVEEVGILGRNMRISMEGQGTVGPEPDGAPKEKA